MSPWQQAGHGAGSGAVGGAAWPLETQARPEWHVQGPGRPQLPRSSSLSQVHDWQRTNPDPDLNPNPNPNPDSNPDPDPNPNPNQAHDWQGMQEEAADEAERFAATLTARLRAEGNTALVSLRRPRDDGYATLVKLLAGQTDASKPVRVSGSGGGELRTAGDPAASSLSAPLVF